MFCYVNKILGDKIDIHCGGVDHIPVHHTNEIAESEAVLGHKWVNYWMHGEFLVLSDGKMSKSKGDFLTLSKIEKEGFSPMDYRYFCLQSRYRKQLMFSFDALRQAQIAYKKLKEKAADIVSSVKENERADEELVNKYKNKFQEKISDDLNIPNAFTVLFEVIKDNELTNKEKSLLIESFDTVFSLDLLKLSNHNLEKLDSEDIKRLICERNDARNHKDWHKADVIRDELKSMGIDIIDSKEGTKLKVRNS